MAPQVPDLSGEQWTLLPAPQDITFQTGALPVAPGAWASITGASPEGSRRIRHALLAAFGQVAGSPSADGPGAAAPIASFSLDPASQNPPEGYHLVIDAEGIRATASDEAGLYHAAMTIKQLTRQARGKKALPFVEIRDWPDFANRGVMLDISRCKVPEMETLYALVDELSEWKLNQLQLYMEHTFAYAGHHVVWENASPMTAEQVQRLDAYCHARYIELVPNQNSFGHMERWLEHPEYAHLAELPENARDLCPIDPGSIELVDDLYAQLLPNFTSNQFNVGCDETWTLGKGRSKEEAERIGKGRLYFSFLMEIYERTQRHGKTMQFWGDIIMRHPELIPEVPGNVVALEWGYDADHPFEEHGKRFADSGVPFYVVPGTSTWLSIIGRTANAMENLRSAAENGRRYEAEGYLITDWGDRGHWQFLPISYPGFAYGAGLSWCYDANAGMDVPSVLSKHVFEDDADVVGHAVYDLGNAYLKTGEILSNRNIFDSLMRYELDRSVKMDKFYQGITTAELQAAADGIERILGSLSNSAMRRPDGPLVLRELQLGGEMAIFSCKLGIARIESDGAALSGLPETQRKALARELRGIIVRYRQLWMARNRVGGLKESTEHLEEMVEMLDPAAE